MTAPHDGSNPHASKRSESKSDSRSPFLTAELNTPASTLSLKILPADLTPAASPTDALVEAFSMLNMRSPSMPTLSPNSSPSYPPGDLHSKAPAETPHRGRTDTMQSVVRAFSASKTLHQVLGMRDPEPFVPPPAMPSDLRERFEAGLQEYEQLYVAGVSAPRQAEGLTASVLPQQGKTSLADILEEKESPVRATPTRLTAPGTSGKLKINVPKWTSGKQAIAVAQRHTFLDSDSDAVANDTASEHTDDECDDDDYSLWKYGSSTTLAVSDYSRPGSSASGNELSSMPAPSFPPRTSSLLPLPHEIVYGSNDSDPLTRTSRSKNLPPRPDSKHPTATANSQHPYKQVYSHGNNNPSTLRRTESLPVLFPSPGVEQQSSAFVQTKNGSAYGDNCSDFEPHSALGNTVLGHNEYTASSPAPRITIQAPSPVKAATSRKRAPSSSTQNEIDPPLSQRSRRDDVAGLPVLSPDTEAEWTIKFPGNTHALLTILLTWSHAMWAFHHRLPVLKPFSIHPAFPYSITPPLRKQLLSVSFYDTSVEPHKEIRFLGPDDVAEMSYHEVDIFDNPAGNTDSQAPPLWSSSISTIKQTLGLADSEAPKQIRYMDMSQRAKTGEGRWCYILIKGYEPQDGGTPPHLILAWHISAVTATSDCLHTIFPDNATPKPTTRSQSKLKRFSSLQNFGLALCSPAKFNFHQTLRSASSSSELPPADEPVENEQRGGTTLHRTVLKMEKAGNIPLVEGYRVDIAAFRDWMDACGKGEGKVIMWKEREG
ncbi:hypothetical protein BU25DRAFT_457465 [Macroventuria anomochaeta]|uniref:Uncharacterized protein n=1 Tax=Macroventuria anomochaeta TaxID=301207 RepID=A0ACB6S4V6_9PLEO|nr:uncharacterized protein BU25DRAFT_457465 [Macroventuria anomochaeta]KAF2628660.1 hypothetical protein BU25DRAFT_457465 [Macroventuria anomochaeta]